MKSIGHFLRIVFLLISVYGGLLVASIPVDLSATHETEKECVLAGCNNELCVEQGQEQLTACEIVPENECLQFSKCVRISPNKCGFKPTYESELCMALFSKQSDSSSNPKTAES